jgi:hypothetical protein
LRAGVVAVRRRGHAQAAATEAPTHTATSKRPRRSEMTTSVDSKAVVERYITAAESGDERAIREIFAEDAAWQLRGELPISGTRHGQDTIIDEFLATALGYYEPGS